MKFLRFAIFSLFIGLNFCISAENSEAKVFTIGSGDDEIKVVVVSGTPYEMGFQLGKALKEDVKNCMSDFLKYAEMGDSKRYNTEVLDNAWISIEPYLKDRFKEELLGLSDGSQVPWEELKRAHMIPVVGNHACSGVSVWGSASENGNLYQIRNLDFSMGGGLQDYPTIVIYLPNDGIPHASATFAGYIGAHTGINAEGIVLSEKGGSPNREYPFDLNGTHFSTLFRDLLYDANTLYEALNTLESTKLIKRYHLYIGDGKKESMGAAKILVSSPDSVKLRIWKDNDLNDEVAPKVMENACYYTMDNDAAYNFLTENHGKFNSEKMIELSRLVADEDGNLENVVYDATNLEMWVAYANGKDVASSRPYIHLDLKEYFKK
ncbi:MAG: C45 family peptidase [Melioribacteraceae bacterium]